jgi:hypothetical protein
MIYFVVPEAGSATSASNGSESVSLKTVYSDPRFWRLAPISATCAGTAWALQGLWAAPSGAPLRATAPGIPDDVDSPLGNGSLPADKAGPEGKAPPSQVKLDIILTMRRPRIAAGRHRAHRGCR